MGKRKFLRKIAFLFLAAGIFCVTAAAQKLPEPRQEKLLNGLKLLMWPDAKADKVWVKIRVHYGSAFDPQGKEGLMKLLSDSFFPNENAREFFTEDLGGSLEVISNYDYIQVNASSKPDQFLTMIETLATAISNPTIDKETTAKLRTALLAKVAEMEAYAPYVADQALAKRLFGTFPYGRPQLGSTESLKRIEFPDLLDAKQRFLTADNATMAISGNFDRAIAFRGVRRYFGSLLKAEKSIPSTFRQPDEPPTSLLLILSPATGANFARFAIRGPARNDKDLPAAFISSMVVRNRMRSYINQDDVWVLMSAPKLPGILSVEFKAHMNGDGSSAITTEMRNAFTRSLTEAVTDTEFMNAKAAVEAEWSKVDYVTGWLDLDTYAITDLGSYLRPTANVSIAQVNAYLERARKLPVVSVFVQGPAKTK